VTHSSMDLWRCRRAPSGKVISAFHSFSCPIRLYPATSQSERISFHLLNPKTHTRVSMRPHDAETDQQLERSELVRGYEFSKGRYVIVTEEELEAIEIESSKTVDLTRFVDPNEVDLVYPR